VRRQRGRARPLTDEGGVDANVLVEEAELDAGRIPPHDAFAKDDLLDLGTVFPDGALDADVDPATAGQVKML